VPGPDTAFVLADRQFDPATGVAEFTYELGGDRFTETLRFDGLPGNLADSGALAGALDLVHLVMGTSYYKLRAPGRVTVTRPITVAQAAVAAAAYDRGLREFAAVNSLPLPHEVHWDVRTRETPAPVEPGGRGPLLPIGGGKDSALVLASLPEATALAINPTDAQRRVAATGGMPLLTVRRRLDPLLGERTRAGGLNGHVPVTAINSAISTLAAVLGGYDPVVFANERSADEETVRLDGVPVNHQYSKSFHFEQLFAAAARELGVGYFSITRQLSELATVAAVAALPDLRPVILSCNRAYTLDRHDDPAAPPQRWCLECSKCAFTFLSFAVFLSPDEAVEMFGGNPLDDAAKADTFAALWSTAKPFDCVGERAESAAAMAHLAGSRSWGSFPVVAALGTGAREAADAVGATIDDLLTPAGPHLIPEPYAKRLTDRLDAGRRPIDR
jgi:hypothetical protein